MKILDMCCGGRMFWENKQNPLCTFMDNRELSTILCDGRIYEVKPDIVADFRNIPFPDDTFDHVVFDPPHLIKVGAKSWLATKYGKLSENWRDDLKRGFDEGLRVLKPNGVLVFKWNETDISVTEIVKLFSRPYLYGNKTSKNTFWIVYKK